MVNRTTICRIASNNHVSVDNRGVTVCPVAIDVAGTDDVVSRNTFTSAMERLVECELFTTLRNSYTVKAINTDDCRFCMLRIITAISF